MQYKPELIERDRYYSAVELWREIGVPLSTQRNWRMMGELPYRLNQVGRPRFLGRHVLKVIMKFK